MKSILLIICMIGMPVLADPVTWTIDGTMSDGGTVTGSFVFDDDTDDWSDVLINYEGGYLDDFTFTISYFELDYVFRALTTDVADATNLAALSLFDSDNLLTNAGGTFNFTGDSSFNIVFGFCTTADCKSTFNTETMLSGTIIGVNTVGVPTSVPEPGTMALLVAGLAGLALRRRKLNRSLI